MDKNADSALRQQLVNILVERQAHMIFEDAVKDFPPEHINTRPTNVEYTFWHLIEHIRYCQWDILDYLRNPNYTAASFPSGNWRKRDEKTDLAGWNKTIDLFLADRQALVDIVQDPATDLYAPIPHGWSKDHNVVREVLVAAGHNAYHTGELGILRQLMGLW
ncbi:MAG: DinB family protein [Chloroflexi bacterium]|nr:DinB family protein [Chloroflexota bacterium]